MSDAPKLPSPKPKLEDLLRLKRAERPNAEFWADFDARMRQRQLAAMIQPARWTDRFSPTLSWINWRIATFGGVAASAIVAMASFSSAPVAQPPDSPLGNARSAASERVGGRHVEETPLQVNSQAAQILVVADNSKPGVLEGTRTLMAEGAAGEEQARANDSRLMTAEENQPRSPEALTANVVAENYSEPVYLSPAPQRVETLSGFALEEEGDGGTGILFPLVEHEPLRGASWAKLLALSEERTSNSDITGSLEVLRTPLPNFEATNSPAAEAPSRNGFRLMPAESKDARSVASPALGQIRERLLHRFSTEDELYASTGRVGVTADRLSLRF